MERTNFFYFYTFSYEIQIPKNSHRVWATCEDIWTVVAIFSKQCCGWGGGGGEFMKEGRILEFMVYEVTE